jgi:hypothetical protein
MILPPRITTPRVEKMVAQADPDVCESEKTVCGSSGDDPTVHELILRTAAITLFG